MGLRTIYIAGMGSTKGATGYEKRPQRGTRHENFKLAQLSEARCSAIRCVWPSLAGEEIGAMEDPWMADTMDHSGLRSS